MGTPDFPPSPLESVEPDRLFQRLTEMVDALLGSREKLRGRGRRNGGVGGREGGNPLQWQVAPSTGRQ